MRFKTCFTLRNQHVEKRVSPSSFVIYLGVNRSGCDTKLLAKTPIVFLPTVARRREGPHIQRGVHEPQPPLSDGKVGSFDCGLVHK